MHDHKPTSAMVDVSEKEVTVVIKGSPFTCVISHLEQYLLLKNGRSVSARKAGTSGGVGWCPVR